MAQFGDDYLLSGDPARADYYGYNFYHVQTDFEYFGINSDLGHGWKLDNKSYTYRYWNKQNYNGTTITKTSAIDKLNGYRKVGDVLAVNHESARGIFRTGSLVRVGLHRPLPDSQRSQDLGGCGAAQLPRTLHHQVVPAVCRV